MKKVVGALVILIVGAFAGTLATMTMYPELSSLFGLGGTGESAQSDSGEKEPLYWVAPMDPNYRRDQPGQSPMGMDLIPVYEEDEAGDSGPGTVKISPEVVNNLGVRTAPVRMAELETIIKTVGYIEYDEDELVHIHPRVNGWIEKLHVKAAGDPVKKGQPLYDIYSPELVNAQEELLLALERNSERLIRAAELRLDALRVPNEVVSSLRKNRKVRQNITFYSPQGGVVDNLAIREGFYVKPGSTLMSIGSLEQVWVEAEVFERQADLVAPGQPVTMQLDYLPGRKWQGSVDYVYPALDPKTRTLRVRLRFANEDDLLKPNMFARVIIHPRTAGKTLLVPKEAIIRTGLTNRVVLALGDGRFKSVNVEVGRYDLESAEILEGLEEGEEVVTSAQFLIDSESSKTSDFKRMHQEDEVPRPASVWTRATVNTVVAEERRINASHAPIAAWDWPEMTMDFSVAEAVDLSLLEEGKEFHIEISETGENQYEVTGVHDPSAQDDRSLDDLSFDDMSLDDMSLD